jgi:hypothetical protein
MNDEKNDFKFEVIEILENVAVIYEKGREKKEVFDAIHINEEGIFTGYILKKTRTDTPYNKGLMSRLRKKSSINFFEEFIESGYIPNHNIKKIEGSVKRKVYMRKKQRY